MTESDIDFARMTDEDLSSVKRTRQSDVTFCNLVDHLLKTREEHRTCINREIERLNSLILSIVLDEDPDKEGLFQCGRLLCEGKYTPKDEPRGMKLIQKSASNHNKSAIHYLIDHYSHQEDWKTVLNLRRSLYDLGERFQLADFLCEHPDLYTKWFKKYLDCVICDGYLQSDSISMDSKVFLVSFYSRYVTSDVTVIAENLPDDADFMSSICIFFNNLPPSSNNPDVKYFIAYNHIFGMSCTRDVGKGMEIMNSLIGTKRDVSRLLDGLDGLAKIEYLTSLLPDKEKQYIMKVVLVGESCTGKTSMWNRLFKGETFEKGNTIVTIGTDVAYWEIEKFGTKLKFQVWDTAGIGRQRFIVPKYLQSVNGCVVVFHDHSRLSSCNCDYWYKLVQETKPGIPMFAVVTKCDLEESSPDRISSLEQYYNERGVKCIRASAKSGLGFDEILDTMLETSLLHYVKQLSS